MSRIRVKVVDPGQDRQCYRLRYRDPVTGKQVWRSSKAMNRVQAERAAAVWEEQVNSGAAAATGNIAWDAFKERLDGELLPGLAKGTADNYRSVLRSVEAIAPVVRLSAMTTSRLSQFVAGLRKSGKSENTIKSYLKEMRAMLSWAHGIGLIATVPAMPRIQRIAAEGDMKGRPLTDSEYAAMRDVVPAVVGELASDSWQYWLDGLWWSGLRLEESLSLSWDQPHMLMVVLDGERTFVAVRRWAEKAHRDRLLPMAPEFGEFLRRTPPHRRHGRVFNLAGINRTNGCGAVDDADWVSTVCRRLGKAAGIVVDTSASGRVKYASAHDLRRSFGVRWAKRVMPAVLQILMRHKDIKTTMKYYIAITAADAANEIHAAFLRAGGTLPCGSVCGSVAVDSSVPCDGAVAVTGDEKRV